MDIKIKSKKNKKTHIISDKKSIKFIKTENKILFFLIKVLFIFDSISNILSDLNIKIKIHLIENDYSRIINLKNIGKPSKIYIGGNNIQSTLNNINYKIIDDYLYAKTANMNNDYYIKLIWKSEISINLLPKDEYEQNIFNSPKLNELSDLIDTTNINNNDITNPEMDLLFDSIEVDNSIPKTLLLDASEMFKDCKNIKIIDFSKFDTKIIYNMSEMFSNCESLIEIKYLSPINAQDMSYLFNNCTSLTKINFIFPESMIND